MTERMAANPAATDYDVTVVNHSRLSRRYCSLRVMQSHIGAVVLKRRDRRTCPGMVITDLDEGFKGAAINARGYSVVAGVCNPGSRMPVHTIDLELPANQVVTIANDDTICCRIQIDHIARTRRAARQPFALTDCEQLDAIMFADKIPINVVNFTTVKFAFSQMGTQKRLVIVAGNKTNFLAVDLVGNLQA